jgi:predicted glycosyltransferase
MTTPSFAFLATGRSGLGHLRRIAAIAGAVRSLRPDARLTLVCNGAPDGLTTNELSQFTAMRQVERSEMAHALIDCGAQVGVLDTLQLPGAESLDRTLIQVLRETPVDRIAGFERGGGRPWDAVLVPNPPGHWMPAAASGFARRIEATGWIARRTGVRDSATETAGIVVATGGGGTVESRAGLYPVLDAVIATARSRLPEAFRVRQALGPRSGGAALAQADEVFDPGPNLDQIFRAADVVISTAGYNSVLELAGTDTPALLSAIPRSLDDQAARVRLWGPALGHGLDSKRIEEAVDWLAEVIERPRRRPPVDLGPDGAARAAEIIVGTT